MTPCAIQTQLDVDRDVLWSLTQRRAPQRFTAVRDAADTDGYARACPDILAQCQESPDLNPFQTGVDFTFTYGSYLDVAPRALRAYYSNTFLARLDDCATTGSCNAQPPPDLQVCDVLDSLVLRIVFLRQVQLLFTLPSPTADIKAIGISKPALQYGSADKRGVDHVQHSCYLRKQLSTCTHNVAALLGAVHWRRGNARVATQVACIACYCQGISSAAGNGTLEYEFYSASVAKQRCASVTSFDRLGAGISVGVAVVLALVNTALSNVIASLASFERRRSHSQRHRSLCAKLATAQYLNTSITPLIASAEIRWLAVAFGGVVFENGYPDYTTNWCARSTCNPHGVRQVGARVARGERVRLSC